MLNIRFCLVFVTQVVLNVWFVESSRNKDLCTEPNYSCGKIPPVLPESFTLKAAVVDILEKSFTWREEYFDAKNLRAKVIIVRGGNEFHVIFDYTYNEIILYANYFPGAEVTHDDPIADMGCVVENMQNSKMFYVMRYRHKYGSGEQSRMYSSNEVLNYGGRHKYQFLKNTTIEERGLFGDVFQGCVYDEDDDKTLSSSFYWTDINNVITPSGDFENLARMELSGGSYVDGKFKEMKEIHDIVWFSGQSEIPDDIFQIPPRMECQFHGRPKYYSPKLPNFFSTRIEVVKTVEDWQGRPKISYDWQEEVWYDYDLKLVRIDYVHSDELGVMFDSAKKFGQGPVSVVVDYNTGVVHYTEKTFGKCIVAKIPDNLFVSTKNGLNKGYSELAPASEIFGFDGPNVNVKGKYNVRGISTQAWSGRYNITQLDGTVKEVYREFYVSEGGWHEDYDDEEYYEIPIRDTQMFESLDDNQVAKTTYDINFFKFKKSQPHISAYDISGCLTHYTRKFFRFYLQVEVTGNSRDNIERNYLYFLDALRHAIANSANVGSPLRVQELETDFTESGKFRVVFSLLDVPKETQDISLIGKGVDLDTAVTKMKAVINSGLFEVQFRVEGNKVSIKGEPNSVKELQLISDEFLAVNSPRVYGDLLNSIPVMTSYLGQQYAAAANAKKPPSGYSSGSLAGLAIAMLVIGVGIGIITVIVYHKRKSRGSNERVQLT